MAALPQSIKKIHLLL